MARALGFGLGLGPRKSGDGAAGIPQPASFDNVVLSMPMSADFNDVSDFAKTPSSTGGLTVVDGYGVFSGSADIEFADFNEFALAGKQFSIEAIVNFDVVTGTHTIAAVYNNVVNKRSWVFQFGATGLGLFLYSGSSNVLTVERSWSPSALTDYHVALCVDGDMVRFFVDGVQLGATATGAFAANFREFTSEPIRIGSIWSNTEANFFDGKMKHLRIISGESIYTSGFPAPAAAHPTSGGTRPAAPTPIATNVELDVPMSTDFDDVSDNSHTASDTGGLSIVSNRGDYDGTGDIEYADDATFELSGASAFCIECQVEFDALSWPQGYFSKYLASGTNRAWFLRQLNANQIDWIVYSGGGTTNAQILTKFTPTTGTEYHVAITYDGSEYRVWVDGRVLATKTEVYSIHNNATDVAIGGLQTSTYLDGKIRDFRITVGEELYTENFTPPA